MKATRKDKKPERAMALTLSSDVLAKRCHFESVPASYPCMRKATLAPNSFGHLPKQPTISFRGIASVKQQANYFSPNAANIGLLAGDLVVARTVEEACVAVRMVAEGEEVLFTGLGGRVCLLGHRPC